MSQTQEDEIYLQRDMEANGTHRPLTKNLEFLWTEIYDAYIATKWLKPGYAAKLEKRSECQMCLQAETMEHILTKYSAISQCKIWLLADAL